MWSPVYRSLTLLYNKLTLDIEGKIDCRRTRVGKGHLVRRMVTSVPLGPSLLEA